MSERTVSKNTAIVNGNTILNITFNEKNVPVISSLDIGARFGKKHSHVLREVEQLRAKLPKEYQESNFGLLFREQKVGNGTVRKFPYYTLTRDAFTLLAMGFTGQTALVWKLKYIEAFNALEKQAFAHQNQLAHESGYQQGIDYASSAPALQANRKEAYLQGMHEGTKLQKRKDGYTCVRKAIDYFGKGLKLFEVAKLLGVSRQTLANRLKSLGIYEKAVSGDLWWETPSKKPKGRKNIEQASLV